MHSEQEKQNSEYEKTIQGLQLQIDTTEEKLNATQDCLMQLHTRASQLVLSQPQTPSSKLLESILGETLQIANGDIDQLTDPPSTNSNFSSRVTDAESRQAHQRTMSRLRQLTEKLKTSTDGRLVSPSTSPVSFPTAAANASSKSKPPRPADLSLVKSPTGGAEVIPYEKAAALFAKQVSTYRYTQCSEVQCN